MAQSKSKTPTEYTHEQLKERAYTILCDRFHLGWVYPEVGTAGGYFDVLGKRPHHRHIVGVECKASRADFLSDIRSDKWKNYLPYCNELWFYVNRGVCEAGEAPGDVGLMFATRSDHILRRTVKKAGTRRIHHLKYIEVVEALFGISHYRKFPHVYWKGRDERRETSYWKKRCEDMGNEIATLRSMMNEAGMQFCAPQIPVHRVIGGTVRDRWWDCPHCGTHHVVWNRRDARKGALVKCHSCKGYAQVEKEKHVRKAPEDI